MSIHIYLYIVTNKLFLHCRTSKIFQPALVWSGHRVHGRRMADSNGKYEHVHVRNRSCVYSHGKRGADQDEGNHRMEGRRLDFCSR